MSEAGGPVAGWYEDPTQPGTERWWDGQAWGTQTRPVGQFQPPAPPGVGPIPENNSKGRSGCLIGGVVVGVLAMIVLLGGCAAVLFVGARVDEISTIEVDPAVSEGLEGSEGSESNGSQSDEPEDGDLGGELADVVRCARLDEDTIELEVVNNSPRTSSYYLTVAYFDDSGQRVGDEWAFIENLRPGERTIEKQFTFDGGGTSCEVISGDRQADESSADELAEASACQLGEQPDFAEDFQASLSVTNGTDETSDYVVEVALVDPDGIRRGTGTAYIETVRPDETAPSEVFTVVDFAEGYSCEVVGVSRTATN